MEIHEEKSPIQESNDEKKNDAQEPRLEIPNHLDKKKRTKKQKIIRSKPRYM